MSKADTFIDAMKDESGWSFEDLIAMGRVEPFDPPPLVVPMAFFAPENRVDLLKALWEACLAGASLEFLHNHEGGPILGVPDPTGLTTRIIYEKITYNEHTVIEAEGVVVCHL